jgi:hypothetical protein
MRLAFALISVLFCLNTTAQIIHVYPDELMRPGDLMASMENGLVRNGDWRAPVALTLHERKIFQGFSSSSFDLLYTIAEDNGTIQLRRGDGRWSDDVLYTWFDGQVFMGDSRFALDLVYTIRNHSLDPELLELYREDSISRFDRLAVFAGRPTPDQLLVLMLAQGLL